MSQQFSPSLNPYMEDSYSSWQHGYHGDRVRRLQSENDYLKDRVRSCEKGLTSLYQLLHIPDQSTAPRVLSYHRSASQQFKSLPHPYTPHPHTPHPHTSHPPHSPHSPMPEQYGAGRSEDRQVTIPELHEAIQVVVKERDDLLSRVDDFHRITEAAKRERVLAIDEKDKLLHSSHLLKMAVERKDDMMRELEEKHNQLMKQCTDLEEETVSLQRANEEARQTRSMALEERSKVIEERNQLKLELGDLQSERDELFGEKVQLQTALQELASEKRKLVQDVEFLSRRCQKYETIARKLKEQNEVLNERVRENLAITMDRPAISQPWGFSIEGGLNTEFFHNDPSIVVTGIAENSPAYNVLKFGDRILSVDGRDFQDTSQKDAAEVLKSCDQLTVTMEISRVCSKLKPHPLEVRIPGKKAFGFSYESHLFVNGVEEGSAAADWLLPGDEIVQVMGKSASNMKPSHLKQILKSCKGGVAMTIHRSVEQQLLCGRRTRGSSPGTQTASSSEQLRDDSSKVSSDFSRLKPPSELTQCYQAPGTPGSTMSESSAGYHSSHSIPSVFSTMVSPAGQEMKAGQTSSTAVIGRDSPRIHSAGSHSQHSGYETDQTSFDSSLPFQYRTGSSGSSGLTRSGYYTRPGEMYGRKAATPTSPLSQVHPRTTSLSSYTSSHTGLVSPKADSFVRYAFPRSSLPGQTPQGTHTRNEQNFSLSVDHLESESDYLPPSSGTRTGQTASHDKPHGSHVTTTMPLYPRQALSLSNMHMTGNDKQTNV